MCVNICVHNSICLWFIYTVQIPLWTTFYSYFEESFSGECHIYQLITLHSCDYLKRLSIQINVATDEGNSRNEM